MTDRQKRKKEILERRLEEYYTAESKILKGQSYTLGTRQLNRASLAAVQKKIAELESLLGAMETSGTTKRRLKRVVPLD